MTAQPGPTPGEDRPAGQFLRPLRDIAALVAVAAPAVLLFVAVLRLIPSTVGEDFGSRTQDSFYSFVNVPVIVLPLLAVLLATLIRPVHPRARVITMVALVEYAVAAVFGVVFGIFVGLVRIADFSVRVAFEELLVRLTWLAIFGVAAYAIFQIWRNLYHVPRAVTPPGMYGQPQQYGPQGQPYGPPPHGQQYPPQPYPTQQFGPQQFGPQQFGSQQFGSQPAPGQQYSAPPAWGQPPAPAHPVSTQPGSAQPGSAQPASGHWEPGRPASGPQHVPGSPVGEPASGHSGSARPEIDRPVDGERPVDRERSVAAPAWSHATPPSGQPSTPPGPFAPAPGHPPAPPAPGAYGAAPGTPSDDERTRQLHDDGPADGDPSRR